ALLRVEAVELVEDPLALRARDAEPLVGHLDLALAVLRIDPDLDLAALGRVLDRVVDEVDEHLPELVRVAEDRADAVALDAERDPVGQVERGRLEHPRGDLHRVAGLEIDLDGVGVELAREQDLVDELGEPDRLVLDDLEEGEAVLLAQLDVLPAKGANGSVDGGERRAQLVRSGRDEVAARLLERMLVGDVAERVDRSLAEVHTRRRNPELAPP